jgi:hypothetical protein
MDKDDQDVTGRSRPREDVQEGSKLPLSWGSLPHILRKRDLPSASDVHMR